jgi:hypothetical protein
LKQAKTQNHWFFEGIIRVVVLGIVLFVIVIFLSDCLSSGRGVTTEEGRREHGNGRIYPPFCCVYVGLDESEQSLFEGAFQKFADQHGLRKAKRYRSYSGPPRAQFVNDRIAVYVHSKQTSSVIATHDKRNRDYQDHLDVQGAMWFDCYWPTNASQLTKNGQKTLAPITGSIGVASYVTNYSWTDFKQLTDLLKASMQAAFPDRDVEAFVSDSLKR